MYAPFFPYQFFSHGDQRRKFPYHGYKYRNVWGNEAEELHGKDMDVSADIA